MTEGIFARHFWCIGIGALVLMSPLRAEVVFDGTVGPGGTLTGNFEIPDSFGTQVGQNLFHSFSTFNVNTGESATFTSSYAGVTNNVIGRVTGDSLSTIDGLLASTIPGAAIWLINPNGVMLGDNASLSVPGAFHVSTADYLLLEDGGRFDASDVGSTVLTMANPVAFGFLGSNPAPIAVGASTLEVTSGETLSMVGGDIDLASSTVQAPEGRINLVSMRSAGEVQINDYDANRANLSGFGDVTLNTSLVNTDGQQGGDIYILGGQFFGTSSSVTSHTSGATDGGDIRIDVDDLTISELSGIQTFTFGDGSAGDINIDATGTVAIVPGANGEGAQIQSIAQNVASGDAGSISINASDFDMQLSNVGIFTLGTGTGGILSLDIENTLSIMGGFGSTLANNSIADANAGSVIVEAGDVNFFGGSILVRAFGDGDAGRISVTADNLTMANGTQFGAGAFGAGMGGVIDVNVADTITLTDDIGYPTAMISGSANGDGGDITVRARIINLFEGGEISNGAFGTASAGDIVVDADEGIFIRGRPAVFTGIFSNTFNVGDAGNISITTPMLELTDGGSVQASAFVNSTGDGGSIILDVGDIIIDSGNSFISARTFSSGDGGDIVIDADSISMVGDPDAFDGIFAGTDGTGDGGSILIDTGSLEILDGAFIQASTFGDGNAGSLTINSTGSIVLDAQVDTTTGIFNSTFGAGQAGSIVIDAADLAVTGLATIQAATAGSGNAGTIDISAVSLNVADGGLITTLTDSSGSGGTIRVAADGVFISSDGAVSATTSVEGAGGDIMIEGRIVDISDGGTVSASATGTGNAGTVIVTAVEDLTVTDAAIETSAENSAGGNIDIRVGDTLFLNEGGTISASAGGVTAMDDGGNILIDPIFVILRESSILATANAGNGGNIGIRSDYFIIDANSEIDASSQTGLDGRVTIDAVDNIYGSVLLLETPSMEVPGVITQKCVAAAFQDRSSLTVEQRETYAWSPEDYLPSPLKTTSAINVAASSSDECRFSLIMENAIDAS